MAHRSVLTALALGLATFVASCGERQIVLPGTREPIDPPATEALTNAAPALSLSAPQSIASWPMRGGSALNAMPHAAFSAQPQLIWAQNIGAGSTRKQIISVDPVSGDGRIFTRDAASTVTAVSQSGAVLWSRDLTPPFENPKEAHGGGLGLLGDTLYAATGFGELHALDAATGAEKWVQKLDAPITAPTFSDGVIYLVSRDNRAWAITPDTGRILWDIQGTPGAAVLSTSPGPAVTNRLVIFPFGSGELIGVLKKSGLRLWGTSISGGRTGVAYQSLRDIAADPVVVGRDLYAGTPAGQLVAMNARSGVRRWTASEGAASPVVVDGGSVFFVSDQAELLRLDAETGARIWGEELPFFRKRRVDRRQTVFAHFGPVLAGGRLWLASTDEQLRGFNPQSGALEVSVPLPGGAATRPIVVGGVMYVVSRKGQLLAYR